MRTIGSYAFRSCTSLSSVSIPGSVTNIGEGAFDGCSGLRSLSIANGVTEIGERAFRSCSALSGVRIPSSVASIGIYAFYNCTSLAHVTILNPECEIYDLSNTLGVKGTTTIHGYAGSTAESYADRYGFTFVPLGDETLGDVTGDGELDLQDVTLLFQAVNKQAGAEVSLDVGDVNGDGKLDLQDVTLLFQFVNGQIFAL